MYMNPEDQTEKCGEWKWNVGLLGRVGAHKVGREKDFIHSQQSGPARQPYQRTVPSNPNIAFTDPSTNPDYLNFVNPYGHAAPHGYPAGSSYLPQHYQQNYPPPQPLGRRIGGGTIFRHKTRREVELTREGNFVVDIPVPEKVLSEAKFKTGMEFTHMRYTAVCGDPDEFVRRGYTLRPKLANRHTELFIVMTMYNEDEVLFARTWKSVAKNIAHMCAKKKKGGMWGENGWTKVVVCVVSDGRVKIHPKTLTVLGILGAYQEGVIKTSINGEDVAAHMFEYTTQVCVDQDLHIRGSETGLVPIQMIFCLKEKNAKKINSHRWFFNAFGRVLEPNVCILLDVGTKPSDTSLYRLWKAFDESPQVAGACGEIYADLGRFQHKLVNPLIAAQNFEYKMSNILDKPLESVFGFISVLPGAFSAYRYRALQNGADGTGPLQKYFLGEQMHGGESVTMANMYLAEDRILCFELVTKRNENWILRYVKSAKAETDVPDSVSEFIAQRRRWLNGSFFAGVHAIVHWYQIFRSGHNGGRKAALCFEMFYNLLNVLFNWFQLANFYLIFEFLTAGVVQSSDTDPFYGGGEAVFIVIKQLYLFAIMMIFVASLGNRPQGTRLLYLLCFVLFALIMGLMLYIAGFTIYKTVDAAIKSTETIDPATGQVRTDINKVPALFARPAFRDLVVSLLATYGSYFICSFAYLEPWHMYLLMLPSFVNILMVYAFCNLHDVTWGTKGDNVPVDLAPVMAKRKTDAGKQVVTTDLPVDQGDIDTNYELLLRELAKKEDKGAEKKKKVVDVKLKQEDYFKLYRTRVVLLWIISNFLLVMILTTPQIASKMGISPDPKAFNPYLTFILWSVAILSVVRFWGSMAYLTTQGYRRSSSRGKKGR
ncbi:Chitin synthase, class 2 [Borealophlyctis nickersoniae]|nr:Chitin synthase, class 2 [Borealophlyctis nickersoniae]